MSAVCLSCLRLLCIIVVVRLSCGVTVVSIVCVGGVPPLWLCPKKARTHHAGSGEKQIRILYATLFLLVHTSSIFTHCITLLVYVFAILRNLKVSYLSHVIVRHTA